MTARRSSKRRSASESSVPRRRRPSGRDFIDHTLAVMVITFISLAGEYQIEEGHPGAINAGAFWWIFIPLLLVWIFLPDRSQVLRAVGWTFVSIWRLSRRAFRRSGAKKTEDRPPVTYYEVLDTSPTGFEHAAASILRRLGFQNAAAIGKSRDLGVDIEAVDNLGRHVIGQCKKRGKGQRVSSPDLQPLTAALGWDTYTSYGGRAAYGVFFTMGEYTPDALALALDRNVIPIDREGMVGLLRLLDSGTAVGDAKQALEKNAAWNRPGAILPDAR